MTLFEGLAVGAMRAFAAVVLNRLQHPPLVALTYGKTGNNDAVRLHYRRTEERPSPYPWIITDAVVVWPLWAKVAADDANTTLPVQPARRLTALRLKPDRGIFFIPLAGGREYPPTVHLLVKVERSLPAERRWALTRGLRPSGFDLRFPRPSS